MRKWGALSDREQKDAVGYLHQLRSYADRYYDSAKELINVAIQYVDESRRKFREQEKNPSTFEKLLDSGEADSLAVAFDRAEEEGRHLEWLTRATQIAYQDDETRPGVTTSYIDDRPEEQRWYASVLRYGQHQAKTVVTNVYAATMAEAHAELARRWVVIRDEKRARVIRGAKVELLLNGQPIRELPPGTYTVTAKNLTGDDE